MKLIHCISFVCVIFSSIFCFAENAKQCEFCGSFYPDNPQELTRDICAYIKNATTEHFAGDIIALIAPHAGYVYSGPVAASAYKALSARYDTVFILAPSHRYQFSGIAVYPGGTWNTPLGAITVDQKGVDTLSAVSGVTAEARYFTHEHAIEVHVPFIQHCLGPAIQIVPVIFGDTTNTHITELTNALQAYSRTKRILVIASSDLSHYQPYQKACAIDAETIRLITDINISGLIDPAHHSQARACGLYPIAAVLAYAKKFGADIRVIRYANSGDTAGTREQVVGYVAAAAVVSPAIPIPHIPESIELPTSERQKEVFMKPYTLTQEEKHILLTIARKALTSHFKGEKMSLDVPKNPALQEKRGAFVTLTKYGQLRGCIGRIAADTPLYKVISEFAIHAAIDDSRFSPVTQQELNDISIEISVLTPFTKIHSIDEIEIGRHGALLEMGWSSAIFLPQVPIEWGWDKQTFLEQLCRKARLPIDAYKKPEAALSTFEAIVFSEHKKLE